MENKKYLVKTMVMVGYNSYRSIVLCGYDDYEQATDRCFEISNETRNKCWVDINF